MTSYTLEVKYHGERQPRRQGSFVSSEKAFTAGVALMKDRKVEGVKVVPEEA